MGWALVPPIRGYTRFRQQEPEDRAHNIYISHAVERINHARPRNDVRQVAHQIDFPFPHLFFFFLFENRKKTNWTETENKVAASWNIKIDSICSA